MITARIIADSINSNKERLTTMVVTCPRIVLAEFNTHRAFSRNSASSRAIPFAKMVKMVEENPFIPIAWQKDHKGMQGKEYLDSIASAYAREKWLEARDEAVRCATYLNETEGVTKQLCNRLLEPFMWHTIIVTATDWDNFFALRLHPDAEIHIAKTAEEMLKALNGSTPKKLEEGEWHIPFGDNFNEDILLGKVMYQNGFVFNPDDLQLNMVKIAIARCARVSYVNFEGKDDYLADISLFWRLLESGHMSPMEHCAVATSGEIHGNFRGWKQYRKMVINENREDKRLIKYDS